MLIVMFGLGELMGKLLLKIDIKNTLLKKI